MAVTITNLETDAISATSITPRFDFTILSATIKEIYYSAGTLGDNATFARTSDSTIIDHEGVIRLIPANCAAFDGLRFVKNELADSLEQSRTTIFLNKWNGQSGLTEFPFIDVSSGTDFRFAWQNCSSLTSFPLLDVSSGTKFRYAWQYCSSLTSFPANMFDSVIATDFAVAFSNCALNETSVDNILVSINAAGTSNGTLNITGGTSSPPSATGLSAKTSLEGRGWTVTVNT